MMRAKRTVFPVDQCSAIRQSVYARDGKGERFRCTRTATYTIDGFGFCAIHAGKTALSILLMTEESDK